MSDDKYETHIKAVLSECPQADTDEVKAAFIKYEEEFYIPPQDALRSIIRRFQGDQAPTKTGSPTKQPSQTKKVTSLSELTATDRDVEIEVEVVSHNLREQTIRGEQKQIAFGLIEDNPWEEGGTRVRWEYKDWGPNSNITPGSVIRIEGAAAKVGEDFSDRAAGEVVDVSREGALSIEKTAGIESADGVIAAEGPRRTGFQIQGRGVSIDPVRASADKGCPGADVDDTFRVCQEAIEGEGACLDIKGAHVDRGVIRAFARSAGSAADHDIAVAG